MNKLFLKFKRLICRIKGHDWETYTYQIGYYSYDIEQAGHCKRCGVDTHRNTPIQQSVPPMPKRK